MAKITLPLLAVAFLAFFSLGGARADLLITDVTLIDGTGAAPVEHAYILVKGDRIAQVRRTPIMAAEGTQVIDGSGKVLIPGLIDAHIHLTGGMEISTDGLRREKSDQKEGVRALHGYLYSGVTSVFDAGNNPDHIFALRKKERAGKIVSPRIFAAGAIVTAPGGHGGFEGGTLIESWPEGRTAMDKHLAREPDLVKLTFDEHNWGTRPLIPLLPLDVMQEIIEYSNEHGVRTTVHASNEYRARQAIYAGIDTLAHPVIQSPISEGFARLMGARKTPMVSTLTIGEGYSRLVEHPEFLDQRLYQAVFGAEKIKKLKTETRDAWAKRDWTTWMKVMTPIAQENLRQINAAGGVIVLGSDQSNGPAAHRELELLVSGGISPAQAIKIATLNGAIFLGKQADLGSVEEGKLADMVLLNSDPLADINNAKDIALVIKGGQVIDLARLDLPVNR